MFTNQALEKLSPSRWTSFPSVLSRTSTNYWVLLQGHFFFKCIHPKLYRVFIKYCAFSLKFWIFLNSASSAAALVFYLPCVCTHTDNEGKQQRKARFRNILKSSEKTQYLMNTLKLLKTTSTSKLCRENLCRTRKVPVANPQIVLQ